MTHETQNIDLLIEARFPLLILDTHEEQRAEELARTVAARRNTPLYRWKVTEGLTRQFPLPASPMPARTPAELLGFLPKAEPGLYLLLDLHPFLAEPLAARQLKDAAQQAEGKTLILVGHALKLPDDLEKMAARFDLPPLSREEVLAILKEEVTLLRADRPGVEPMGEPEAVDGVARHLVGLGATDTRRVIRQVLRDDGLLTQADFPRIFQAKRQLLGQSGVLSLETTTARLDDLAGLGNIKRWLLARREAFRGDPGATQLEPPKGILLLGVQGCGKSVAAKAVATAWDVPLLRLDVGALYNKYLGETERNLRDSLKIADAMAPCVLWLDEIEKGLASSESDGGESRRVLGALLTWMAERSSRVFLVATSNDIERLPPELVRKGRMDEIFFVDLPDELSRREIARIHLQRRDQKPENFDLAQLAQFSQGFSGAEIEQGIISALYAAQEEKQDLATAHIVAEMTRTKPLSVVMAERIAYLRLWARDRTVSADFPAETKMGQE